MGCSLEAWWGPIYSVGMLDSWKDNAESLVVSRLLDVDWWGCLWICHISPVPWCMEGWSQQEMLRRIGWITRGGCCLVGTDEHLCGVCQKRWRKRKRIDDTPGPTQENLMISGPPWQQGPSGQTEPSIPDSSIGTPAVAPTPTADPAPKANPSPAVNPTPMADPTPLVHPPIISSPPVRPPPFHPPPVHPLLVHPPPVVKSWGGLFGGGLQGLDDHNPLAKWAAQSWLIWHKGAICVANCVKYQNDDEDTIRSLDVRWSYATIWGPKLQDVRLLGRPGPRYMGLLYRSGGVPQSWPGERLVFIERDEDVSTSLKLIWDKEIPNEIFLVLPQAAPDADRGRLLASFRWVLYWLQSTAFTRLMNLLWPVVWTFGIWIGSRVVEVDIIRLYSAGFRLVFRWSCMNGNCVCPLEGNSCVVIWFSCRSGMLGMFICGLDGIPLAALFGLLVYCCLDIVT